MHGDVRCLHVTDTTSRTHAQQHMPLASSLTFSMSMPAMDLCLISSNLTFTRPSVAVHLAWCISTTRTHEVLTLQHQRFLVLLAHLDLPLSLQQLIGSQHRSPGGGAIRWGVHGSGTFLGRGCLATLLSCWACRLKGCTIQVRNTRLGKGSSYPLLTFPFFPWPFGAFSSLGSGGGDLGLGIFLASAIMLSSTFTSFITF